MHLVIDLQLQRIVDANAAALKFFRYSLEKIRTCHLEDLFIHEGGSEADLFSVHDSRDAAPQLHEVKLSFGGDLCSRSLHKPASGSGKKSDACHSPRCHRAASGPE
ncbi:MAG: PAS domain-containing protein [Candidatus Omnitrophica bacterium]|nr:PAS domain-containing protein [Candidatus Omnitrophota bacterium]